MEKSKSVVEKVEGLGFKIKKVGFCVNESNSMFEVEHKTFEKDWKIVFKGGLTDVKSFAEAVENSRNILKNLKQKRR